MNNRSMMATCSLVLACFSGCTESARDNSQPDAGSVALNDYQRFCHPFMEASRCGPRCLFADDVAHQACLASARDECAAMEVQFRAMEAAGVVSFRADLVPECLAELAQSVALNANFLCTGEAPSAEELAMLNRVACVDGRTTYKPLAGACYVVINGTAAPGTACASDTECFREDMWGSQCMGASDGGCGTCTPYLREAGENCVHPYDGGTRYDTCAMGSACDVDGGGTCKPERRPGESCGPGIGDCAPATVCGTVCVPAGDGGNTCQVPADTGESCQDTYLCKRGNACVGVASDGGFVRTCRLYAAEGEACADGYRFDWQGYGGVSTTYPLCVPSLHCVVSPGESTGTCRPPAERMTGETCDSQSTCVVPGDRCNYGMFPATCTSPPGLDEPCQGDGECIPGLFCVLGEPGASGHCAPLLQAGSACPDGRGCSEALRCFQGTCVVPADAVPPYQPAQCQ